MGRVTGSSGSCPLCGYVIADGDDAHFPDVPESIDSSARQELERLFTIERTLGKGGMSIVYLAREVELNRPVAIKVLPLLLTMDTDAAERFKREAQIAASLDHPHIVPIYQVGATSTFVWYSMKWVKGQSLRGLMRSSGPLPLEDCLRIIEPVANALSHAHARGVVHRDIKPENVLIDETGWVMVCDFGIAKVFGNAPLTPTGGTIGTPGYMSPEQCYGQQLDGRTDQYALAVMAYECLSGGLPFTASSLGEIVRKHCLEAPPRVSGARPSISEEIADVLVKAMSKQPEDRYEDVTDFVRALGGNPVRTTPSSLANLTDAVTVRVPTPRNPFWARIQAIPETWRVGATVAIALGAILWSTLRSPAPRQEAPPSAAVSNAIEYGLLSVNSNPWGDVFVDNTLMGQTPRVAIQLTPGRHQLRIVREGYRPYEQIVEIATGDDVKLGLIEIKKADAP